MQPRPFVVRARRRELADTVTLELTGDAPLPFSPGQFNMLYAFGVGEIAISISGDPAQPEVLRHTVRAVGRVSEALCGLRRGEGVGVRGPYGTPWPVAEAEGLDVLVVAGGLGLAPLRPAILHLIRHRQRYGHLVMCYGARTPADVLYQRELARWQRAMQVEVTVDSPVSGWQGSVGVVTALLPRAAVDPARAVAMVCGPEIMMRFVTRDLLRMGLPPERIYLSMERNMKCAIGLCGHCQLGPAFLCKDGPVLPWSRLAPLLSVREL